MMELSRRLACLGLRPKVLYASCGQLGSMVFVGVWSVEWLWLVSFVGLEGESRWPITLLLLYDSE